MRDETDQLTTDWIREWFADCREADRRLRPTANRTPAANPAFAGSGSGRGYTVTGSTVTDFDTKTEAPF
jgi:hypothetical protein